MERVNYIIATWPGDRRAPNEKYLKEHLLNLLSLKHNLSQITIVKPIESDKSYYDIDELVSQFECDVVILDRGSNEGQSYGQLFYAYETFKDNFDYYVFVEDDYIADLDYFDKILVDEYKNQGVEGYLCSFAGFNSEYPDGGCSVSNGIISTEYMEMIYKNEPNPAAKINSVDGNFCHKNFADLLISSGLRFKDFAHKYRVPYYGNSIIEYGRTDTEDSIFIPNQLFNVELKFDLITFGDLPEFLEIRNKSREFLHNDSEFTLEECTRWFNESNPEFYMIKMGIKTIGYFRTSKLDKDKKSLYIGCDIHPSYRGYGFGYDSYVGFIEKIKEIHDLKSIELEVLSTNDRAIGLYNKLGFKETNVEPESICRGGKKIGNVFMKLEL